MEVRAISGILTSQRLWMGVVCYFDQLDEKKFTTLTSFDIIPIRLLSDVFEPSGNASHDAFFCFTLIYCTLLCKNKLLKLFIKT